MTLTLFKNPDDLNVVNKNLTQVSQISVNLKDGCSIINPVLYVNGVTPTGFNYFYLPEFQRYYYVTNQSTDLKGTTYIEGHVDVLYTYRTKIYAITGVAERSESIYNKYLTDNMINTLCYDRVQVKSLGKMSGANVNPVKGSYYLQVAGK